MTTKWLFERKRRSQKSRDPMQASFFTNASIDDDTHALVREGDQNSLDAKCDPNSDEPVRVRFSIGSHAAQSGVMNRYISEEDWLHFNAEGNGLTAPPGPADDCRYLVFEDFNTIGLIGNERAFEAEPQNSFYYFMRSEGQSGKKEGELGRHGIGKYVFPYTSGIRAFFAVTVRSDDGRCFIAGQSVLKSHSVGDDRFTPDGWWGEFEQDGEDDYFPLPVEDMNLFQQMKQDFNFDRKSDQSGLSLIMPYIQEEVTADKIAEHVVCEFFWPILSGRLVVEVVEDGNIRTIDSGTIHENLDELIPAARISQISPYINLAFKALSDDEYSKVELKLPDNPAMPKWDKDYLPKETAAEIHQELARPDGFIRIRCPLHVQESESTEVRTSHFDIFLSKDVTDVSRKPQFMREGIIIPEDRVPKVRGYTSVVVIDPGAVATMLGDSENPAHTEWEKNATKFKGKYRWGSRTIDFVRLSVNKFLNLMSQGDDEEDPTILSDIFYLDLPENEDEVPESRKKKKRESTGPDTQPPIDPPPPPRLRKYRLTQSDDGFVVKGPIVPLEESRKYTVRVAYDFAGASKARAIDAWHKNDFNLGAAKNVSTPVTEHMSDVDIGGNTVEFRASSSDFKLVVNGFDSRRDIIVDVDSEVITDEAV